MLFEIFWIFFKISALTIGGGYAMIPVFEKSIINKGWMEEKEFYNLISIAQSLPGPIALNAAMLLGKRIKGVKGAIAAWFGVIIPPFFSIVVAASIIMKFSDNLYVQKFLKGCYAATIGMVIGFFYKLVKNKHWDKRSLSIFIAGSIVLLINRNIIFFVFAGTVIFDYIFEKKVVKC